MAGDEDRDATLLEHRLVVGIPVVVLAARRCEDLAEQQPEALGIDLRMRIIGADQLGLALDRRP